MKWPRHRAGPGLAVPECAEPATSTTDPFVTDSRQADDTCRRESTLSTNLIPRRIFRGLATLTGNVHLPFISLTFNGRVDAGVAYPAALVCQSQKFSD